MTNFQLYSTWRSTPIDSHNLTIDFLLKYEKNCYFFLTSFFFFAILLFCKNKMIFVLLHLCVSVYTNVPLVFSFLGRIKKKKTDLWSVMWSSSNIFWCLIYLLINSDTENQQKSTIINVVATVVVVTAITVAITTKKNKFVIIVVTNTVSITACIITIIIITISPLPSLSPLSPLSSLHLVTHLQHNLLVKSVNAYGYRYWSENVL